MEIAIGIVSIVIYLLIAFPIMFTGITVISRSVVRGSDHTCLQCNYDLRGHQTETGRCPECGADLAENMSATQVVGWRLALGLILIIGALPIATFVMLLLERVLEAALNL